MIEKEILFISPEFFSVDSSIISVLTSRGAHVTWKDERSVKSSFARALNSISPVIFYWHSNRYYKKIIKSVHQNVDIILVIKGEMVSKKTISEFRKRWPTAEIILYLYDPVKNIKGILQKVDLYDRVISFEPRDCDKYGFEFRALFCDFRQENNINIENKKYDICFYGTMYSDRFNVVYQMKRICETLGLSFYSFCFLRGKFMAFYYWFTNFAFRKLGLKAVSFVPKKHSELMKIINNSEIILDVNDINQQGLTIRTLETLICGKKMITTNADIKNYDFYNSNNICVVDRENMYIPQNFLDSTYEPISFEILQKYTDEGWVEDVFGRYKLQK